jgi:hypothetical protein
MAAKPQPASSLEVAEQWALVLVHALEHPTVDKGGCVCFETQLLLPKGWEGGDPVSKCPRPGRGVFDLQDLARIARCVRRLIRELRRSQE